MPHHFFAYMNRMKYIRRWGLMRNTRPENDQEHALQAALRRAVCARHFRRAKRRVLHAFLRGERVHR